MLVHPEESKVQGDASKYQVVGASLNNKLPHIVESSVARVNKYMGSKIHAAMLRISSAFSKKQHEIAEPSVA
jgi:hypothetical protein